MSIKSKLHFIPVANPSWQPDTSFVRKLCNHIGGGTVWAFLVFARALDWEVDEEEDNEPIATLHNIPVEQVLDEVEVYQALPDEECPATLMIYLFSNEWREAFCQAFNLISEDVRANFHPWEFGIVIGPERLTHHYTEEEFGTYAFQLTISGHNNAYGEDKYVSQALMLDHVTQLKAFLEKESGETFGLIMTMS